MTGIVNGAAARRVSFRTLALLGSALGSTLVTLDANAQNVVTNNATDYNLTETGTRQGGPRTIDATNTGGNITIDVENVEAVNNSGALGGAIFATNTGTGSVSVKAANTTATGNSVSTAINASGTAAVTVTSTGTASSDIAGTTSRGINALSSNGGAVTVVSNIATGTQRGISATGIIPVAGGGTTLAGTVNVTSTNATATGTGTINAIVAQADRVVVNSGTATNSNTGGTSGTAIFANAGAGGVLLTANNTSALGRNQAAMQVFSGGAVDVTSNIVRTTQNSDGISVASGTDIVVRSTQVSLEGTGTNTGAGIVLGGNRGGGGFNSDANGIRYNSATITSGSITTVAGSTGQNTASALAAANGIYVTPNGNGTTTINSGAITTSGNNSNGILVAAIGTGTIGGATTINSTGALQTSGNFAFGIRYLGAAGGTGAVTVNNSGTITTGGAVASGIGVSNANGATITSNAIVTTGTGPAGGIVVGNSSAATNAIRIESGTVDIRNANSSGSGILVSSPGASAVTIISGSITSATTGSGSAGIGIQAGASASGDIAITSGNISLNPAAATTGFRPGISTASTSGTTTITSTGTIQSGGQGIVVQQRTTGTGAQTTNQAAGAVNVTSNAITTTGGNAINVMAGSAITINATGPINAAGTDLISMGVANGIRVGSDPASMAPASTANSTVNITSSNVTATGTGIAVAADATTVASGTLTGASGIALSGTGAKVVTSGTVATTANAGQAIAAISDNGTVSITSTGITGRGSGISANGFNSVTVDSGTIALQATAGNVNSAQGLGINAILQGAGTGTLDIKSGSIAYTGAGNTVGITAQHVAAGGGALNITSGDVSVIGNGGYGILGSSIAAAVTINSTGNVSTVGTTRSAGGSTAPENQRYADGIQGISQTGAVSVTNAGTITTAGATARGIVVEGGRAINSFGTPATVASTAALSATNTGAIVTAGANATGISVRADQNAVTVASKDITTTGANANGIQVVRANNDGISGVTSITSSGALRATGAGSFGITVASGTNDVTVANTGSITSDSNGISLTPVSGNSIVTSNNLTTTAANANGILIASNTGTPQAGNVTVLNTGALAANGANSVGINVQTTGTATITNNGTIAATQFGISVIPGAGAVTIGGTGTIATGRTGILVGSDTRYAAPVTITTGGVATTGDVAPAIQVSGSDGAVSVTSGPITTAGTNAAGIQITGIGNAITVNASDVRVTGANNVGITVGQNTGAVGAVTVQAGTVRATSAGVAASGVGNNAVSVTTGDVQSVSNAAVALGGGAATINSGIARSSATGALATTLIAISNGAAASVTAVDTTSAGGRGIFARGLNDASVTSGTLTAAGGSIGIIANTTQGVAGTAAGTVTVNSGTLTSGNIGINAFGPRATVNVASTTLTAGNANAIEAYGLDVTVNSGSIVTNGSGVNAGNANGAVRGANVTVTSGTVTMNGLDAGTSSGLFANGQSVTINSGTITATGTGNRVGINAIIQTPTSGADGTLTGPLTINSGSITTVGDGAYGIRALGDAGLVTINSTGTITTVGGTRQVAANTFRYSDGITATSFNGSVAVTSNNIATSGAEAVGIRVEAGSGLTQNTPSTNPITGTVNVTSTGTITTAGTAAAGILVRPGAGATTIANTGSIATTGNGATGIAVAATTGATNVSSNAVSTQGTSSTGIQVDSSTGAIAINATTVSTAGLESAAVRGQSSGGAITIQTGTVTTASAPAIFANSTDGAVSITAANTTAGTTAAGGGVAAFGANAIDGRSTNAAVTINAGTVTGNNATAVSARAGTTATVTATDARATGEGSAGVRAVGGTGVTLNVATASSTGAAGADRADAIFAEALTGAIDARVGSASAQGAGADAVHLIANGTGGAVTLNVSGTVSSANGNGIFIDPPGAVNVTVASGASVTGALAGITTESGTANTIVNAGTVRSTGGAAIVATGATTLDNAGAVAGTGATAVQFGATDDRVILRTGSSVTGAIQGGGGTDSATLIGTGTAPVATQTVATLRDFATLTVQSGYWTAPSSANPSTIGATTIASGAALELAAGPGSIGGLQTGSLTANGTLVVRTTGTAADTFGATVVTGTGGVRFTGTGTATLAGSNSVATTGTNTVDAGATVLVTGTQGGTFANNGTFQIGTGGTTGNFTGNIAMADTATLIINRSDAYAYNGALTGNGTFIKNGAGQVVFGTGYAFTGVTQLNGGSVKLSTPVAANTELDVRGTGTVDLSGQRNTVAELQGNSAAATVNIAGGALTVNQSTSTAFAGNLTGDGALTKTGSGTLNLTGTSTYTGPTTVAGGTLAVNGSIASAVTVASGGALGGAGTINAPVTIGSGGSFAPGNSPGTTTINGSLTFAAGSTYAAEVTAAGAADRIIVNGAATINGGTVAVNASGAFLQGQLYNYNLITASGGVTGRFANVTSNLAFLSPQLGYTSNAVNLTLIRNDVSFRSMASGTNQTAVAIALAGRTLGDAVFDAVLFQPGATVAGSFDQLTGEVYATVPAVLIDGGRRVRELVLNRAGVAEDGVALWADGLQNFARSRFQAGYAQARTNRTGIYGGVDFGNGDLRYGVNGGYVDQQIRVAGRASSAEVDTKLIGASVAYRPVAGRISAMGGLTYAWHDLQTSRTVSVPGLAGSFATSSDARSTELFAEVAYAMPGGPVTVSPFVRYAHDWTQADRAVESGGGAAARFGTDRRDVGFATVGARFGGAVPLSTTISLQPKGTLSYERAFGDLRDGRSVGFVTGNGPNFTVTGVRLGRDTFGADLGGDLVFASGLRVGAAGFFSQSEQWRDHGGKVTVGFRF